MIDRRRNRYEQMRALAFRRDPVKAVGILFRDESVESLPACQRGCAISAARNGMLWRMPRIANASSAAACALIASPRVGAWVTSFAIIGS
jgi:hypothetical protein